MNRSGLITSLALLILLIPSVVSADGLREFSASYSLYRGGLHLANTELRLEQKGDNWRWRMSSKARSIYAWFTKKEPFTETLFQPHEAGFRLQRIIIADKSNKKKYESAEFDWDKGNINVVRKGKQKQLPLNATVFDYQSIHLLAASMREQQLENMTVDFYRKGKLVTSQLVYAGKATVDLGGMEHDSHLYEQVISRSKSKIRYYYDVANPLLPLRMEILEADENPSIMTLKKVDYKL